MSYGNLGSRIGSLALAFSALGLTALGLPAMAAAADGPLRGAALVQALQHGGYVIVMRHAYAPGNPPDKAAADPGNTQLERQLDDVGRKAATDIGTALRERHIRIGAVLTSPTFRARQTVQLARLGKAQITPELDEPAQGMQGTTTEAGAQWLRQKTTEPPAAGTNTVLITHYPNVMAAFKDEATGAAAGEMLVFHPDGKGGSTLVARIKPDDWATLPH
jgi:phosphohistidine phosphatase SixA